MHARGPGAVERLQESAAMIANYPARGPVCEPSPFLSISLFQPKPYAERAFCSYSSSHR